MHNYKRRTPSASRPHQRRLSAPVSRPLVIPLICCHSPWIGPLTLSHSRCVGPGASLSFRATSRTNKATPSPPLSFGAIDRAGEFHPSVARPPRCELELSIVSGKCAVGWGSLRCTVCRGLAAGEPTRAVRADAGRVLRPATSVVGHVAPAYSAPWLGCSRPSARYAHGPSSVSAQKPFKN
jgi:hypothetical protein